MTPDERRAELTRILDEHDRIATEFRQSLEANKAGAAHLRATGNYIRRVAEHIEAMHEEMVASQARIEDSTAAANKAIASMLAANRAVRALYHDASHKEH